VGWGGVITFSNLIAIPHYKHAHPPGAHTYTHTQTHTLPTFTLRVYNPSPIVKKKQDQHTAFLRNGDDNDDADDDDDDDADDDIEEA